VLTIAEAIHRCRCPILVRQKRWHMGKALLFTVVVVPVLLGVVAGRKLRFRRGLRQLVIMTLAFNVAYMLILYYLSYKWL
jgi:hypothetical protein